MSMSAKDRNELTYSEVAIVLRNNSLSFVNFSESFCYADGGLQSSFFLSPQHTTSSSQNPSPPKKPFKKNIVNIDVGMLSIETRDRLGISPDGWIWNGDRWEDLFNGLRYLWRSNYGDLISTTYDGVDSLGAAMVMLGFTAEKVRNAQDYILTMQGRYGQDMVNAVLSMETYEDITEAILRGCVDKFSSELGEEDYPDYEYSDPPSPTPASVTQQ